VATDEVRDFLKFSPPSGRQSSSCFLFSIFQKSPFPTIWRAINEDALLMNNFPSHEFQKRLSWVSNSKRIRQGRPQVLGCANKWSASKDVFPWSCLHDAADESWLRSLFRAVFFFLFFCFCSDKLPFLFLSFFFVFFFQHFHNPSNRFKMLGWCHQGQCLDFMETLS